MIASSAVLALAGTTCLFAPVELLRSLDARDSASLAAFAQLTGALYLAFAMTNWAAKGSMIGGIYSRPLSVGNFTHFTVGALTLLKHTLAHGVQWPALLVLLTYASFAALFAYLVFVKSSVAPTGMAKGGRGSAP
jgi:hypothetical protein